MRKSRMRKDDGNNPCEEAFHASLELRKIEFKASLIKIKIC